MAPTTMTRPASGQHPAQPIKYHAVMIQKDLRANGFKPGAMQRAHWMLWILILIVLFATCPMQYGDEI